MNIRRTVLLPLVALQVGCAAAPTAVLTTERAGQHEVAAAIAPTYALDGIRANANASGPVARTLRNVIGAPYINQKWPAGADGSYTNGGENCTCTCLAMICRSRSLYMGRSDAKLITYIRQLSGASDGHGTEPAQFLQAASALGIALTAVSTSQRDNLTWTRQQLRGGHAVVVCGTPLKATDVTKGHGMLITGLDGNGGFIINNPATQTEDWSAVDLRTFIDRHVRADGSQGGMQYAVSN